MEKAKTSNRRTVILLLLLIICAAVYGYFNFYLRSSERTAQSHMPNSVPQAKVSSLDKRSQAEIEALLGGFQFDPQQHTLDHAIKLDQSSGRQQMSQGRFREAFETYRQVLGISYHLDNLMGIQIGLGMLSSIYQRMDRGAEQQRLSLLTYRVSRQLNNPEEYGVVELKIARELRAQERSLAMGWLLRARESLRNTRYQEDYVRVLVSLAQDLDWLGHSETEATYQEAWAKAQQLSTEAEARWAIWEAGSSYGAYLQSKQRYSEAESVLKTTPGHFYRR